MRKLHNEDTQNHNQLHQSFRSASFLLLNVVIIFTIALVTDRLFPLIFKSQKILKPAASAQTVVKPVVQIVARENIKLVQSQGKINQLLGKSQESRMPYYPLRMPKVNAKKPVVHFQPQSQKKLFNTQKWQKNLQKPQSRVFTRVTARKPSVACATLTRRQPANKLLKSSVSKKESPINFKLATDKLHQIPAT